jgi:FKBP-type peptidyl-prolyl cis-trans isomerases 2
MKAKKGDKVKLEYTGKLKDGTVFDRSKSGEPIEFVVGEGRIIPGIERAVEGMNEGESKTVSIPPGEAYGQRDEDLVRKLARTALPAAFKPEVGTVVSLDLQNGESIAATIVDVTEKDVVLDLNHPLAGRDLAFDIKLVGVESPQVVA